MPQCFVNWCSTNSSSAYKLPRFKGVHPVVGVRLFTVPLFQRENWSKILKLKVGPNSNWNNVRICSRHFSQEQYYLDKIKRLETSGQFLSKKEKVLLPSAVPDQWLDEHDPPDLQLEVFDKAAHKDRISKRKMTENGGTVMSGISISRQRTDMEEACEHDRSTTKLNSLPDQSEKDRVGSSNSRDELSDFNGESLDESSSVSLSNGDKVWSPDANDTLLITSAAKHAPPESQLVPSSNQTLESGRQAGLNYHLLASVGLQTCLVYKWICKKIYGVLVPEHSKNQDGFFEKYPCAVVTRKFLADTNDGLKIRDEKITKLQEDNMNLKIKLLNSEQKVRRLTEENEQRKRAQEEILMKLEQVFSKAQLDRLLHGKNTRWSDEDFKKAITLLAASGQAYTLDKKLYQIPKPCESSLRKLLASIKMPPGVLENVLTLMEIAGKKMSAMDKICVLSFDEVAVNPKITYNTTTDQVIGPHRLMQVAQLSGLFTAWTEPVFYKCSQKMTKKTLYKILKAIHNAGFTVVATVCDLAAENQQLIKKLKVTHQRPYYHHPSTRAKVFMLPDPPHAAKLLRNHVLDADFDLNPKKGRKGKNIASKHALQVLVDETSHLEMPNHPLTQAHLNVQGSDRQRCKEAFEFLSKQVADSLRTLATTRIEEKECFEATAKICEIGDTFHKMFGVARDLEELDSASVSSIPAHKLPFGRRLEEQIEQLEEISSVIERARCCYKNGRNKGKPKDKMLPFQMSILISCKALPMLLEDLKQRFHGEQLEILTTRCTQDVLERLFGLLRTQFGNNQRPDPVQAERRLKSLVLLNNFGKSQRRSNVAMEQVLEEQGINFLTLITIKDMKEMCKETDNQNLKESQEEASEPTETEEQDYMDEENDEGNETLLEDEVENDVQEEDDEESDCLDDESEEEEDEEEDEYIPLVPVDWSPPDSEVDPDYHAGLRHIAEEVAGALGRTHPAIVGDKTQTGNRPAWIDHRLKSAAVAPASCFLLQGVKEMDVIFREKNKNNVSKQPKLIQSLVSLSKEKCPSVPEAVAKLFFLKRLRLRIRQINVELWTQRKRKNSLPKKPSGSDEVHSYDQTLSGLSDEEYTEDPKSRKAKRRKIYRQGPL